MKSLEDCQFYNTQDRDGKFTGRVREFPQLRSKRKDKRLDAVQEIITLTAEHIKEIHAAQWEVRGRK